MDYIVPPVQSAIIWSWYGFRWLRSWESLLKVMGAGDMHSKSAIPSTSAELTANLPVLASITTSGEAKETPRQNQPITWTRIPADSSHKSIQQGEEQHNTRRKITSVQSKLNGRLKKNQRKHCCQGSVRQKAGSIFCRVDPWSQKGRPHWPWA